MTSQPSSPRRNHLRRLPPEFYRGHAIVHWTMTVDGRRTGWLNDHAHGHWREMLVHAAVRYRVATPVYCLMPDHAHWVVCGLAEHSDSRLAASFLRRFTEPMFSGLAMAWQKQAYDHVLLGRERLPQAFRAVVEYIQENPVRAGLVARGADWPYSGTVIAGYPTLDWRQPDFWERWWTIVADSPPGRATSTA